MRKHRKIRKMNIDKKRKEIETNVKKNTKQDKKEKDNEYALRILGIKQTCYLQFAPKRAIVVYARVVVGLTGQPSGDNPGTFFARNRSAPAAPPAKEFLEQEGLTSRVRSFGPPQLAVSADHPNLRHHQRPFPRHVEAARRRRILRRCAQRACL